MEQGEPEGYWDLIHVVDMQENLMVPLPISTSTEMLWLLGGFSASHPKMCLSGVRIIELQAQEQLLLLS